MSAGQKLREAIQRGKEIHLVRKHSWDPLNTHTKDANYRLTSFADCLGKAYIECHIPHASTTGVYSKIVQGFGYYMEGQEAVLVQLNGYKNLYEACRREDVLLEFVGPHSQLGTLQVVIDPSKPFVEGSVPVPGTKIENSAASTTSRRHCGHGM